MSQRELRTVYSQTKVRCDRIRLPGYQEQQLGVCKVPFLTAADCFLLGGLSVSPELANGLVLLLWNLKKNKTKTKFSNYFYNTQEVGGTRYENRMDCNNSPHPTPKLLHPTTLARGIKGGKLRLYPKEEKNWQSLVSTSLVLKQQEQNIKYIWKFCIIPIALNADWKNNNKRGMLLGTVIHTFDSSTWGGSAR